MALLVGHTESVIVTTAIYIGTNTELFDQKCETVIATASSDSTVRLWKRVPDSDGVCAHLFLIMGVYGMKPGMIIMGVYGMKTGMIMGVYRKKPGMIMYTSFSFYEGVPHINNVYYKIITMFL